MIKCTLVLQQWNTDYGLQIFILEHNNGWKRVLRLRSPFSLDFSLFLLNLWMLDSFLPILCSTSMRYMQLLSMSRIFLTQIAPYIPIYSLKSCFQHSVAFFGSISFTVCSACLYGGSSRTRWERDHQHSPMHVCSCSMELTPRRVYMIAACIRAWMHNLVVMFKNIPLPPLPLVPGAPKTYWFISDCETMLLGSAFHASALCLLAVSQWSLLLE